LILKGGYTANFSRSVYIAVLLEAPLPFEEGMNPIDVREEYIQ